MASYLEILPDPEIKITPGGLEDSINGTPGQGFASVKLTQKDTTEYDRTLTGRLISRRIQQSKWFVNIKYNPMTKEEFRPVYSFLMQRKNSRIPFFIALPQYKEPKSQLFTDFLTSTSFSNITTSGAGSAGNTTLVITNSAWSGNDYSSTGLPTFGDLLNITDSNDSLHTKTYMVSRVETFSTYITQPSTGTIRLHISPGLQRNVTSGSIVNFYNPLLRVNQLTDIQEYDLEKNNLYQFSISLEEALY